MGCIMTKIDDERNIGMQTSSTARIRGEAEGSGPWRSRAYLPLRWDHLPLNHCVVFVLANPARSVVPAPRFNSVPPLTTSMARIYVTNENMSYRSVMKRGEQVLTRFVQCVTAGVSAKVVSTVESFNAVRAEEFPVGLLLWSLLLVFPFLLGRGGGSGSKVARIGIDEVWFTLGVESVIPVGQDLLGW